MTDHSIKNGKPVALLSYKEEISALANSLKAVLDADVIVVDKYLHTIVNTFHYRYNAGDIHINSVVGNIIMTQKMQMIYDRKYFADCVSCANYTICELGGVFGTPIMCGEECIGAIALLATSNKVAVFQKKQSAAVELLQQVAAFISALVQNAASRRTLAVTRAQMQSILDNVAEAVAVTDDSGEVRVANQFFRAFFADENPVDGRRMDEILAQWSQKKPTKEKRSVIGNLFYKKGKEMVRLRGVQRLGEEAGGEASLLYLFDRVDTVPLFREQEPIHRMPELLDEFFGKSPAMQRARQNTQRALRNQLSILVECGDRKQADELARVLFLQSTRDHHPVFKVDCAQDEKRLEAALLGPENEFPNMLSMTKESTICLYGIDYLPLYLQKQLVTFLRSNWDDDSDPSHVRVIATSSQNLNNRVGKGYFSKELYNFIAQNKISIPSVQGAPEDIRFYFEKYLARYCEIYGRDPICVREDAWAFLQKRRWEEGVQEIRAVTERIVAQLEGGELTEATLALVVQEELRGTKRQGVVEHTIESQLRRLLAEKKNKEKIAEELGVSRATLYRWIEKYQLG